MSQKYTCKICKYSTDREYDYKKHQLTKKHIKNIELFNIPNNGNTSLHNTKLKCKYCKKTISYKNHIKRHYKRCTAFKEYTIKQKYENSINQLQEQLKILQNKLKHKNNKILELETA